MVREKEKENMLLKSEKTNLNLNKKINEKLEKTKKLENNNNINANNNISNPKNNTKD